MSITALSSGDTDARVAYELHRIFQDAPLTGFRKDLLAVIGTHAPQLLGDWELDSDG